MKIKRRAKKVRFTASSGNVVVFKITGAREGRECRREAVDAEWRYCCSETDIYEANIYFRSLRPDITRLFSTKVEDDAARAAVQANFLYGSTNN